MWPRLRRRSRTGWCCIRPPSALAAAPNGWFRTTVVELRTDSGQLFQARSLGDRYRGGREARTGHSVPPCFVPVQVVPNGCSAITGGKISPRRQTRISLKALTRPASPPADRRSSATHDRPPAQPVKRTSLRVAKIDSYCYPGSSLEMDAG